MSYKFDWEKQIDRSNTNAVAIDVNPISNSSIKDGFSKIPMWIADMSFSAPSSIPEAIIKRANHPLYGYFNIPDSYYESIINWQRKRNDVENLKKENIGYENGVLGGVVSAANMLCSNGDNILIHSPTYVGFTASLTNNGYKLIHSDLYVDEDKKWKMDYEDMEKKIVKNKIHTAIFCNPHNPTGRVWSKEEIEKAYEIFRKYDVYVIEDCIWSDIVLNDNKFTPAQTLNQDSKMRTISFYAPSKTFNLAGLVGSYHIVYDKWLKDRLLKESSLSWYNHPNIMSIAALEGAYSHKGCEWLDELRQILSNNVDYAYEFIQKNFDGVKLQKPQGTYLLYLDCTAWLKNHNMTIEKLQQAGVSVGVIWQDGRDFNMPNSIRMNLALPHHLVVEAMDRLNQYVFNK